MAKVFSRFVEFIPTTPSDWPVPPTNAQEAFDDLSDLINYGNARTIYADALNGSDATGNGTQMRPYQTLQAALAAIVALPAANYLLNLAPGDYGGAPIAWPVQLNKTISVCGNSASTTSISALITYTSLGLSDEALVMTDISVSNQIVCDFTLGGVVNVILANGKYSVKRTDTLPPGPQSLVVINSFTDGFDVSGTVVLQNPRFVGGGTNIVQATGFLLMQGGFFASMTAQIDGTLFMSAVLAQGTTLTGAGSVVSDATSLFNLTVTGPTVSFADSAFKVGYVPTTPADWAVPPTEVGGALDALAAGIPSAASQTEFVYRPGGVASLGVYTTWADVMAALALTSVPKTVYFDDSIVTPAVIPTGTYALENVTFANFKQGAASNVQVANGVTWTGLRQIYDINMEFLNTATVETIASPVGFKMQGATITANGTAAIWENAAGMQFQLDQGTNLIGTATAAVVNIQTVQTFQLILNRVSGVNALAFSSPAADPTAVLLYLYADETGGFTAQAAQFGGTFSSVALNNAVQLQFVPTTPGDWSPTPAQVGEALDQLAARPIAVPGVTSVFVYKPGGVAVDNVYTSWATLYAALSLVAGPKVVEIDDSIVTPAVIPAGAYDLANVELVASSVGFAPFSARLQIADLATISNLNFVGNGLTIESVSTAPVITINTPDSKLVIQDVSSIRGTIAPFISVVGPGTLKLGLYNFSSLGALAVDLDATGSATALMINLSSVVTDSISGSGTFSGYLDASSGISGTQTGFTGVINRVLVDNSANIVYSPTTPADWVTPPALVATALDELAANKSGMRAETHVLTAPEVAAKQFTMAFTPKIDAEVCAMLAGAGTLVNGDDFAITGTLFDFTGLGLDGVVVAGDKIVIWMATI